MRACLVIPGALCGLNEIVLAARSNMFAGASQKKKETRRCMQAIQACQIPVFNRPVEVVFRWFEKDLRRDPDNICAGAKFALDALVELGRIPDDSRRWISGISHEFPPADKKAPRIEIAIISDEGEING
jgi:hypothetical protein